MGRTPSDFDDEGTVHKSGEDDVRPTDFSIERQALSNLNLSDGLFPSIYTKLLPAFVRHNVYHLNHRIRRAIRYESETGARFLTLPVAFGIGALVYFSLPREPLLIALIIALIVSGWLANKNYGLLAGNFALVAAFVFAGMVAGKLRSDMLGTIMIERPVQVQLNGIVLNREVRSNGRQRYTILVNGYETGKGPVPQKIRVTAHKKYKLVQIGEEIFGLARLRPPSGPAYPGGYDFAFQSWFNGIGANGFFLGSPKSVARSSPLPLFARVSLSVADMRSTIGGRIRDALPGESGNLAAALIVGDRSGISDDTVEALRQSGLAHILAISGLHMALVTATIIMLVRATLAMIPGIALHYPIRKWAALAALVVATSYLLISGAGIATQRAWIMIAIMLLAILSDRRALTMRNVGLAALVVLAWRPDSIVSPSFQMSFAAVAALVAVYEAWSRYRRNRPFRLSRNRVWGVISNAIKSLTGLAVTSVVAGAATGLYAAYHFHRVAPFGLIANLAAMPIVSLVVMPMALLSMILMPFGLEAYPLQAMGVAIDQVVLVAGYVSGLGNLGNTGFMPLESLIFGTVALVIATQLKSILRILSLPFLALSLVSFANVASPDILISESGASVAVVDGSGKMHLLNPRKEKFITNIWRKAFAPYDVNAAAKKARIFNCDDLGCTANLANSILLSVIKRPLAYREDCAKADIIITRFAVPDWCRKPRLIIGKPQLKALGAVAISIVKKENSKPEIIARYAQQQFHRPWARHRQ